MLGEWGKRVGGNRNGCPSQHQQPRSTSCCSASARYLPARPRACLPPMARLPACFQTLLPAALCCSALPALQVMLNYLVGGIVGLTGVMMAAKFVLDK